MLTGYVAFGASTSFMSSFTSAGATLSVMLINLTTMSITVPLAFLLSRFTPLNELGIPVAMSAVLIIRPMMYVPLYLSERWLHVRVFAHDPARNA